MDTTKTRLSYYQQLRDPRWLQLSTRIKEESDWLCEHCQQRQGDVELSIHHTYYISGVMMWDHPRCLLICLCGDCHGKRQLIEQEIYIAVADVMRAKTNEELINQPIRAFFTEGFTATCTQ